MQEECGRETCKSLMNWLSGNRYFQRLQKFISVNSSNKAAELNFVRTCNIYHPEVDHNALKYSRHMSPIHLGIPRAQHFIHM